MIFKWISLREDLYRWLENLQNVLFYENSKESERVEVRLQVIPTEGYWFYSGSKLPDVIPGTGYWGCRSLGPFTDLKFLTSDLICEVTCAIMEEF